MTDEKLRDGLKSLYDYVKNRYTDELPDLISDMMYHKVLCGILNRVLFILFAFEEDNNGNT